MAFFSYSSFETKQILAQITLIASVHHNYLSKAFYQEFSVEFDRDRDSFWKPFKAFANPLHSSQDEVLEHQYVITFFLPLKIVGSHFIKVLTTYETSAAPYHLCQIYDSRHAVRNKEVFNFFVQCP